jgi:hypothetical protein
MTNFVDHFIENRAARDRVIAFLFPFTFIGGTLVSILMLASKFYH